MSDILIILLKLELLRDVLKQDTFSLKDIFPIKRNFIDMRFEIPKDMRIQEIREDISKYTQNEFDNLLQSMIRQNYCAGMGSVTSSFPDSWIVVTSVAPKERYILYIQSKRRRDLGTSATPGYNVDESVEKEHQKCKFYQNKHYFIFITDDKQRAHASNSPNDIVITSDLHNEFYGKCLALRKLQNIR